MGSIVSWCHCSIGGHLEARRGGAHRGVVSLVHWRTSMSKERAAILERLVVIETSMSKERAAILGRLVVVEMAT